MQLNNWYFNMTRRLNLSYEEFDEISVTPTLRAQLTEYSAEAEPLQVGYRQNKAPLIWNQQRHVLWAAAETADFAGGWLADRLTVLQVKPSFSFFATVFFFFFCKAERLALLQRLWRR